MGKRTKKLKDVPLFPDMFADDVPKKKRKKRRRRKKRRARQLKAKDLPLWTWRIGEDFEGEVADTFRNIIRDFFYAKAHSGEEWSELELFDYVRFNWLEVPVESFREFWRKARNSSKGKLGWVSVYEEITEQQWRGGIMALIHLGNINKIRR